MIHLFAGLAVLLAAPTQWVLINVDSSKTVAVFVDKDSLTTGADQVHSLRMAVVFSDTQSGNNATVSNMVFDCAAHRHRTMAITGYARDGTEGAHEAAGEWASSAKDSLWEPVESYACTGTVHDDAVYIFVAEGPPIDDAFWLFKLN